MCEFGGCCIGDGECDRGGCCCCIAAGRGCCSGVGECDRGGGFCCGQDATDVGDGLGRSMYKSGVGGRARPLCDTDEKSEDWVLAWDDELLPAFRKRCSEIGRAGSATSLAGGDTGLDGVDFSDWICFARRRFLTTTHRASIPKTMATKPQAITTIYCAPSSIFSSC